MADAALTLERADLSVRRRCDLPAANVSGAGCGKFRRTPPRDSKLGLPALCNGDEPVCRADRGGRAGAIARGLQPRPVRADAAAGRRPGGAGDAGVSGRFFQCYINGDRGGDRTGDDGVEPRRHAVLVVDAARAGGAGRCPSPGAVVAASVDRGDSGVRIFLLPPVGGLDGAGGDRVDLFRRGGANFARDAGRYFLARRLAGRGGDGVEHRRVDLGLYAVSALVRPGCGDFGAGAGRGSVRHRLVAAPGVVRGYRDGPAYSRAVLVGVAEHRRLLPGLCPQLSRPGGTDAGRGLCQRL